MLTIKNSGPASVNWYALPKSSVDITQALAKGTLKPEGQATYDPPATVNILFATPLGKEVMAFCTALEGDLTVELHNKPLGTWCGAFR